MRVKVRAKVTVRVSETEERRMRVNINTCIYASTLHMRIYEPNSKYTHSFKVELCTTLH